MAWREARRNRIASCTERFGQPKKHDDRVRAKRSRYQALVGTAVVLLLQRPVRTARRTGTKPVPISPAQGRRIIHHAFGLGPPGPGLVRLPRAANPSRSVNSKFRVPQSRGQKRPAATMQDPRCR